MGKTKGSKRVRKRADMAAAELAESQINNHVDAMVEGITDDDLFTIDTSGSNSNKRRKTASATSESQKKMHELSDLERRKVEKLIKIHGKEGVAKVASSGAKRNKVAKKPPSLIHNNKGKVLADLWGEEDSDIVSSGKNKKKEKKKTSSKVRR